MVKTGYTRFLTAGPGATAPNVSPSSILTYVYGGIPTLPASTGVRGFAGDHSGKICETLDGTDPSTGTASLPVSCVPI
jgi:hypothetical protein